MPKIADHHYEIKVDRAWNGPYVESSEHVVVQWWQEPESANWHLTVRAPYYGDPPPDSAPGSTDRLWEYEVVELFVAGNSGDEEVPVYSEVELGPHGHYRILQFVGVRQVVGVGEAKRVRTVVEDEWWFGQLTLCEPLLPKGLVKVNAYAVHGIGPERTLLASIPVPGRVPDFHQPSVFRSSEHYRVEAAARNGFCEPKPRR